MKRLILLSVVLFGIVVSVQTSGQSTKKRHWELRRSYRVQVREVVDGDTVKIQFRNGIKDTVRLLGVDAPATSIEETDPEKFGFRESEDVKRYLSRWGRKAKQWLKDHTKFQEPVTLLLDPRSDSRDSENRLLGYLIQIREELNAMGQVETRGNMNLMGNLNSSLLRSGMARVHHSSFSLREQCNSIERKAEKT